MATRRYSLKQKSYIITEFLQLEERYITQNRKIDIAREQYRVKFGIPVPSRDCIYKLLVKNRVYGSLENRKNTGRRRSVRTPAVINQVKDLVAADREAAIE